MIDPLPEFPVWALAVVALGLASLLWWQDRKGGRS